jgi:hypothetical protein
MPKTICTILLVSLVVMANLGCKMAYSLGVSEASPTPVPPQPVFTSTSTPTPTRAPSQTPQASATIQLTSTSTSQPTSVAARIRVQAINLRQGPGTLFPVLTNLPENTWVTVVGKVQGDEWLLVKSNKGQGWLATVFTDLFLNPQVRSLPVIPFTDGFLLRGQVLDSEGSPIGGITFGVTQGNPPEQPRAEATTLPDGSFYVYLPPSTSGDWRVSLVGVDCTSPVMDEKCDYTGEFEPMWIDITLPYSAVMHFTYLP